MMERRLGEEDRKQKVEGLLELSRQEMKKCAVGNKNKQRRSGRRRSTVTKKKRSLKT